MDADDIDAGVYTCTVESANIKCSSNVKVVGKSKTLKNIHISNIYLVA